MNKYYFAATIFDAMAEHDSGYWDFRLYDGNVVLDNVLPYTKLTAGRFRMFHLSQYKLDGAELMLGTEDYNIYGVYGEPVSYYDYYNTTVYGGGLNIHLLNDMITLRGEVYNFQGNGKDAYIDPDWGIYNNGININMPPSNNQWVKTPHSVDTMFWKGRLDFNFDINNIGQITPYGEVGGFTDAMIYDVGLLNSINYTNTVLNLYVRGQRGKLVSEDPVNIAINDYSLILNSEAEYATFGVNLFQGVGKFMSLGAGYEMMRNANSRETYAFRNYDKFMGNLDLFAANTYISFSVEHWIIKENQKNSLINYEPLDEHDSTDPDAHHFYSAPMLPMEMGTTFSVQVTQNLTPDAAMWIGYRRLNYKYDYSPIGYRDWGGDQNPAHTHDLIVRENDPYMRDVYGTTLHDGGVDVFYIGGSWNINKIITLQADYNFETSDIIARLDKANRDIHFAQASLNIAF